MELTKPEELPDTALDTEADTPTDTSPDTAIDTATDTEQGLSVSKVNHVIVSRSEGHSYRDIAKETGLSFATVARILKGVSLGESANDRSPEQPLTKDSPQPEAVSPFIEAVQPQQPQNYFLKPGLTAQEWAELSKKDKSSLLAMVGELRAQNSSLQASAVMRKGNGDSAAYHHNGDSSESQFWDELAKTERVERALRIRDRYTDKKSNEMPTDVKSLLELFKVFAPKPTSELEIYKNASEDTRKNLETLMKREQTNSFDIQLENLRQTREVDLKKLDWELEKWRTDKAEDANKWHLVEKMLEGPVGKAIQSMGTAGAERVRGRKQPKIAPIVCPNCQKKILIDANSDTTICALCGAQLSRSQEPSEPQQQPIITLEPASAPEESEQSEEVNGMTKP